jgi:hypothetical protein
MARGEVEAGEDTIIEPSAKYRCAVNDTSMYYHHTIMHSSAI